MPIIAAYADHPTRPYVRVEINWADVPAASHAGVYRVNVATGECVPLRPYICYSGWELLLSCGHGTFWDTEAPFDAPFYYVTTSSEAPCVPTSLLVLDSFSRTLVDSWGSTESGSLSPLAYTNTGGTVPGNYDVTAGAGTHTLDSINVTRHSTIDISQPDFDIYYAVTIPVLTTGAPIVARALGRFQDIGNTYVGGPQFNTSGTITATVAKVVLGAGSTVMNQAIDGTYFAGQKWQIRFQGIGTQLRLKIWPDGTAQPDAWAVDTTDSALTTGTRVGLSSRANTGNLNGTVIIPFDDFMVVNDCLPCEPVSVDTSTTPITLANDSGFWLKDPVRPCNDRPVPLCQTDGVPGCGAEGILFVGIGPEVYASNSLSLRPMNRRRTIAITRPRGDATTALRLQTLTFTDRDELLELVAPGSPLLFQGPSEYGIPDRYMDIRDVQVSPELSDLRIQIRSEVLPYNTVDRPAGSTQGICGTQVADICRLYPTWATLAATGFTWDDLIRGVADPAIANPLRRTWNDVNAEFADWDAVEAGGRTWTGLLEGD